MEVFVDDPKYDEIIENLYLTNVSKARNVTQLEALKITHVLTVSREINISHVVKPLNIEYLRVDVDDEDDFPICNFFDQMSDFIHDCLKNKGSILVHCQMGVSRSPTAVIAYLIRYQGFSWEEALKLVKEKRRYARRPNEGFVDQVKKFGDMVKKK